MRGIGKRHKYPLFQKWKPGSPPKAVFRWSDFCTEAWKLEFGALSPAKMSQSEIIASIRLVVW